MDLRSIERIVKEALSVGTKVLVEPEAKEVLRLASFTVPRSKAVKDVTAAIEAAREIGFPVALKLVSPDIIHKSDAGGVVVGVNDEKGIREGYQKIITNIQKNVPTAVIDGILVQEMAPKGTEIIIGATVDPTFGPTIMFGLGGIFVEILKDVSFRLAPITKEDAWEMIDQCRT